jgi:colanic acid biosynthesis protein WcaH
MKLSTERFKQVIRDTVLVSLDLLIVNENQEVLLGKRLNPPARGYWFVPGGRIYKGESPEKALARISRQEIGIQLHPQSAIFYGLYHHLHPDNVFNDPEAGATQYLVVACLVRSNLQVASMNSGQHEELRFFPLSDVAAHPDIHALTKYYFCERPPNAFLASGYSLLLKLGIV